jgi:OOP family OmpA-OmpF porin
MLARLLMKRARQQHFNMDLCMNNAVKASLLAAAIAAVSPVFAADSGWYLGLGGGQATSSDWVSEDEALETLDIIGSELGVIGFIGTAEADSDDSDTSVKVFGGYQYSPYFAVELGYADLGENTADATADGAFIFIDGFIIGTGGIKATGESTAYMLDAVGRFNATPWLTLFAKAGVYQADTELTLTFTLADETGAISGSDSIDDSNSGLHFGAGLDFHLTRNIAIRAEWERFDSVELEDAEIDIDNISVAAIYTF